MIRYLHEEEKGKTRSMYEASFPEDTKAFVDYYYRTRIKENRILVMEADQTRSSGTGGIRPAQQQPEVMIHLNPYRFQICSAPAQVHYLVAVATDPSVRRQGKMRAVMERALQDLERAGEPFAFLIPANPRVYESQGFVFVSDAARPGAEEAEPYEEMSVLRAAELRLNVQKTAEIRANEAQTAEIRLMKQREAEVGATEAQAAQNSSADLSLTAALPEDFSAMASFANRLQSQSCDIFPLRDIRYYERMLQELESQEGGFLLQRRRGEITAVVSYGKEADEKGVLHPQLQEVLASDGQEQLRSQLKDFFGECPLDQEMHYMMRILSLPHLVKLLRCRNPLTLKVQVTDDIVCANNGSFAIQIGQNSGTITPIQPEHAEVKMKIQELTRILFAQQRIFIREWV